MRTVVYGGTFNPPHLGHEHVVRIVREELRPDRFLVIPAFVPPHKPLEGGSPSAAKRLALCRLAFRKYPDVTVSDLELKRRKRSYTFDTLSALTKEAPSDEFFLTVGTDQFVTFRTWFRFADILRMAQLAVLSREEDDDEAIAAYADGLRSEFGAKITVIPNEPLVISSSEIRRSLRGELPFDLARRSLDPAVLAAILEKKLY